MSNYNTFLFELDNLCLHQAWYRGHMARQQYRKLTAAICLQSLWRGHAARLELRRHKAARTVQVSCL